MFQRRDKSKSIRAGNFPRKIKEMGVETGAGLSVTARR